MGEQLQINVRRQSENWRSSPVVVVADTVRTPADIETNWPLLGTVCTHGQQGEVVGVYGQHPDRKRHWRPDGTSRGVKATSLEDASDALGGVEWMTWLEMAECIPPAYTEYIGRQLVAHLGAEASALTIYPDELVGQEALF